MFGFQIKPQRWWSFLCEKIWGFSGDSSSINPKHETRRRILWGKNASSVSWGCPKIGSAYMFAGESWFFNMFHSSCHFRGVFHFLTNPFKPVYPIGFFWGLEDVLNSLSHGSAQVSCFLKSAERWQSLQHGDPRNVTAFGLLCSQSLSHPITLW